MFQITYRLVGEDRLRVTTANSPQACAQQVALIRLMGAIGIKVIRPMERAITRELVSEAMHRAIGKVYA